MAEVSRSRWRNLQICEVEDAATIWPSCSGLLQRLLETREGEEAGPKPKGRRPVCSLSTMASLCKTSLKALIPLSEGEWTSVPCQAKKVVLHGVVPISLQYGLINQEYKLTLKHCNHWDASATEYVKLLSSKKPRVEFTPIRFSQEGCPCGKMMIILPEETWLSIMPKVSQNKLLQTEDSQMALDLVQLLVDCEFAQLLEETEEEICKLPSPECGQTHPDTRHTSMSAKAASSSLSSDSLRNVGIAAALGAPGRLCIRSDLCITKGTSSYQDTELDSDQWTEVGSIEGVVQCDTELESHSSTSSYDTQKESQLASDIFMVNPHDTLTKYCTCDLDEIYNKIIKQDCLPSMTNIVKTCRVFVAGESPVLEEEVMISKDIMSAILNPHIFSVLSEKGMKATRLQAYTWPSISRGCSAVIVGEKLSGKTMGFVVPLLSLILDTYHHISGRLPPGIGPVMVVVCSSWQSAKCAAEHVVSLLPANTNLKVMTAWGGCGSEEEISTGKQLLGGCDVLLTTAPCLVRLLTGDSTVSGRGTKGATTSLTRCCHLVFDDADIVLENFSLEVKEILTMWGKERKKCGRPDLLLQAVVVGSRWTKLLGQLTDVLLPLLDPTIIISTPFEAAIATKVKNNFYWVNDEIESLNLVMNFIAAASSQKSMVFVRNDSVAALLSSMMKNIAVYCLVMNSTIHKDRLKEFIDEWHVMQGVTVIVSEPAEKFLLHCDISDAQAIFHTHFGSSWNTFTQRYLVRLTEYQIKSDGQRIDLSNHYHILRSALQQHYADPAHCKPVQFAKKGMLCALQDNGKTEAELGLSSEKLPLNTEVTVEVTELVSTEEFYVVQQDKLQELDNLEGEINNLHDYLESCEVEKRSDGKSVASKPPIGSPCIAKFTDNRYYRGQVKAAENDGSMTVFFVDHGETVKVPEWQVHVCPSVWMKYMPGQAIRCTLAHLTIPPYLSEAAMQAMTHLMDVTESWKVKALEVKDDDGLLYVVELTDDAGDSPLEVWKHLVHQGVALMDLENASDSEDESSKLFNTSDVDDQEIAEFLFGIAAIKQQETGKKEVHFRHKGTAVELEEKESSLSCNSNVSESCSESDLVQQNSIHISEGKGKEKKDDSTIDRTESDNKNCKSDNSEPDKKTKEEHEQPSCKEIKESLNSKEKDLDIHRTVTSESQVLNMKRLGMPPLCAVDGVTERLAPETSWNQRKETVHITIHLVGVEHYKCRVSSTHIIFMSVLGDKFYVLDEELCQKITPESCVVSVKGISVSITLKKAVKGKWMSLFKDRMHRPWLRRQYQNLSSGEDTSETENYDDDGWREIMNYSKEPAGGGLPAGISDTDVTTDTDSSEIL
ncbi:hypothetical protein O3P69_006580 [Scylla paramamosain]|uniref:RNA helicase n=1 Tax=Scylla paramamosain TaxID=85552 RepID=A0AAW0U354_SCYPA